ncbi:uncharacterized protein O3C94_021637 [Discoglossus pictus]
MEVISDLHSQIKNLRENIEQLNVAVTEKEQCLKLKVDDYLNLKTQFSEVRSSSDLQKKQIETLIFENEQYKTAVNDKDLSLQKSSLDYEDLKKNKESQCEALMQQVTNLEQTNISLNSELNELKNFVKLNEASFSEKEALMISQLEERSSLVSDLQGRMLELTNMLKNLENSSLEKETTIQNLQDKYAFLYDQKSDLEQSLIRKEEEMFQEAQKKLEEEGHYHQTIATLRNDLQSITSEKNQLQKIVDDKETELRQISQDLKVCKDKSEEAELLKAQLAEHVEVISDLHYQIKNLRKNIEQLNVDATTKEEGLKQKDDDYVNLKAQLSEVQSSSDLQKKQMDTLIFENENYKTAVQKLSLDYEDLKQNKEGQCNALMQQVIHLEQLNTNLNGELNELKVLVKLNEASLSEKEALMMTHLEEKALLVTDLQSRIQGLTSMLKNVENSSTEKESSIQNLQDKYASLYDQKSELEQSLIKKGEEISNLVYSVSEKDVHLQASEKNVQALGNEIDLLRDELEKRSSNLKNISDDLKEKSDALSLNQQAIQTLTTELDSLKLEYEKSLAQLNAVTQEMKQKESSLHNLEEQWSSQTQHIESLKSEISHLNSKVLQDQQDFVLKNEEFQLKLETTTQEKVELEKALEELQTQSESSLTSLQKQLTEKADVVKELEERLELNLKEHEVEIHQLKTEKAEHEKQVSGNVEEICELKVKIEKLEQELLERQQKSQQEIHSFFEQNIILTKHTGSLENELHHKEHTIQGLLKDLHFVEEQLGALCDEDFSEFAEFDPQTEYKSKSEKFSSLFSVALNQKTSLIELKQNTVAKESDFTEKCKLMMSIEKDKELLRTELQKVKQEYNLEKQSLIEEIAAVRQTSSEQEGLLNENKDMLTKVNTVVLQLQEELCLAKDELRQSHCAMEEERMKVLELLEEVKRKDAVMQNLTMQLSQQKELITTLTDQMKEKDVSLTQVMESMSNEMLQFTEERKTLHTELDHCKIQLQQHQDMLTEKATSISNLETEKGVTQLELQKLSKEKENLKRKLQAALVIRKDLMQKIEKLEVSKQDEIQSEQLKTAELRRTAEDLNAKLESICVQKEELNSHVQLCKQELQEKERRIGELGTSLSEREYLVGELQNTILTIQHSLTQKEDLCNEHLRSIQEKDSHLQQIQDLMSEKVRALQEENVQLLENVEHLKSDLEIAQKKLEALESGNGDFDHSRTGKLEDDFQLQQETAIVHNKVHASLLGSEGNLDLINQGNPTAFMENYSISIKEVENLKMEHSETLNAYEVKCKEFNDSIKEVHDLQQEIQAQRQQLYDKELQLSSRDLNVEEQRKQIEGFLQQLQKMEQYENTTVHLKSVVQDKEAQLVELSTERTNLLNETEMLQSEIQKQYVELESKQTEILNMKDSLSQLDQYQKDKEIMATEIILLQKSIETSKEELERFQQVNHDKENYFETLKMNQVENEKLKHDLEAASLALLEKDNTIAHLQGSLQDITKMSEQERQTLNNKLIDTQKEADNLKTALHQIQGEMKENAEKLDKANVDISNFRTKLKDSYMEEECLRRQSSAQTLLKNCSESVTESLQDTVLHVTTLCEDCSKKEKVIEELENEVLKNTKMIQELTEKQIKDCKEQENRHTEESDSKEQIKRKLQAALLSRKDLLKENKALKEKIDSLNLEFDGLKCSLVELQGQKSSEIALLEQKHEDILSENKRLLMVNENLAAACESLKSTMETIVQEKEAFSFQLNSLKDSQTEELSGWKAKHGELNKEYESLLQAYENISDEIDKMRQVIELTKKEKYELLQNFHNMHTENENLRKQIEDINEERDDLRRTLEARDQDTKLSQSETERLANLLKSSTVEQCHLDEISLQNNQLMEKNTKLKENCENLKMALQNEKENRDQHLSKAAQDHKSEMDMYKSDMEVKISELLSEKGMMSSKFMVLSSEVLELKQQLQDASIETGKMMKSLNNTELSLNKMLLERESELNKMHLENMSLGEKVKILEDDKALLQDEIEHVQEQFSKAKNEKESLGTELLSAVKTNFNLIDKFKSLQVNTSYISQQVEHLQPLNNGIISEKEEEQQQLLEEFEERVNGIGGKDIENQAAISQQKKPIINNKDAETSILISYEDGDLSSYIAQIQEQFRKQAEDYEYLLTSFQTQISNYVAQTQEQYRNQVEDYEHLLSSIQAQKQRTEDECKRLEAELKDNQIHYERAVNEKIQISNEIEAFRKSMSSLQTDRDLLLSELKDMQHQFETVIGQKDNLILNISSENNNLKQELRKLMNQADDFHAENALLGAQLVRYREDLNQVLSLKDNQIKELLRQKLDHIKNLEEEKCDLQKQNREMQNVNDLQKQAGETLKLENEKLSSKVKDQEALIAEINKEKIMFYSRKKSDSVSVTEELEIQSQLQNVSDETGSDLTATERNNGLLEREVNQTKQKPDKNDWDIYKENKELKSQNETFGKAMAALQNNRDSLIEDFKVLQSRYASELRAETIRADDLQTTLNNFKSNLYSLLKKYSLLNETLLTRDQQITLDMLGGEMETLCKTLSTRDLEISTLSSECASYSQQIDAFSKSMASLQYERERLVEQLRDARQVSTSTGGPSNIKEFQDLNKDMTQPHSDTVTLVSVRSCLTLIQ